jgi:hypothetical protein
MINLGHKNTPKLETLLSCIVSASVEILLVSSVEEHPLFPRRGNLSFFSGDEWPLLWTLMPSTTVDLMAAGCEFLPHRRWGWVQSGI